MGYPMGKSFNSHFGFIELPSEILQVGIYEEFIEFDCVDGVYRCNKEGSSEVLKIKKVHCKSKETKTYCGTIPDHPPSLRTTHDIDAS